MSNLKKSVKRHTFTDKQRLDWLECNEALVNTASNHRPHVCSNQDDPRDINHYYGETYREAIDRAMLATGSS